MFKKLKKYVEKVDSGLIDQKVNIVENATDYTLHPGNDFYENHGKLMEIKDYIESHIHGITVQVSGGEKILSDEEEGYNRRPIIIRSIKHSDPYTYNEVKIDGIFMDERDGAMRVYDNYIGFFSEGSSFIKTGTISLWEGFIEKWLDNNNFHEQGYYCSNNQLFKLTDNRYELIIDDVETDVIGACELVTDNLEYDFDLVVICHDKQVLIGYENYYVMETE